MKTTRSLRCLRETFHRDLLATRAPARWLMALLVAEGPVLAQRCIVPSALRCSTARFSTAFRVLHLGHRRRYGVPRVGCRYTMLRSPVITRPWSWCCKMVATLTLRTLPMGGQRCTASQRQTLRHGRLRSASLLLARHGACLLKALLISRSWTSMGGQHSRLQSRL